jgi:tRNA threonylcarbamoyladenosine biosynthesis protein TsaB
MLLLTIETSTPRECVAVVRDGEVLSELTGTVGRGHTEVLLGAVEQVLGASGIGVPDLDAVAVSIGPGRFSGLRVGLATAKGLSAPTGVPVAPVSTLEALAQSARPLQGLACPMLDARRGEVYGALFRLGGRRERVLEDAALPAGALAGRVRDAAPGERVVFLGSGARVGEAAIAGAMGGAAAFLDPSIEAPTPLAMASMVEERGLPDPGDAALLSPVYLRGI